MFRWTLGVGTMTLCFASAAHAQQMPADPSPDAQSYASTDRWTGLYAGLNAGVGFGGADAVQTKGQAAPNIANIAGNARPGLVDLDRVGVIAGGQIGYNLQFGRYVAGVEADLGYTHFTDTRDVGTAQLNTGLALNNRFRSKIDYLGTARARLGVTWNQALFYGTGGLAVGRTRHSVTMFGATGNVQFAGEREKTRVGYAVGGGMEYALTEHVSAKLEYLYYDLGRSTLNVAVVAGSGGAGTGYDSRFKDRGNTVRLGVNYKF
jgi:outer membrane immunogenic protein